jgi:hypothetical protein
MGGGKVSRTAHLQHLLRWFCFAQKLQSGGPDFINSFSQRNLSAPGQKGTCCGEEFLDLEAEWNLGSLWIWSCPRVRGPAIVLTLHIRAGVGWLGTLEAGAALGVNLRMLELP